MVRWTAAPAEPAPRGWSASQASGLVLLRVGSRGSRLALTQAERAAEAVRRPGVEIALVPITTVGDRDRTKPFGEIGARGVFVKELEEALLERHVDVAVHSAKDMTSSATEGLVVGAYLRREDPRDALCGASELRPGMRVGTASIRRRSQLLALEPELSIEPLRGNIDTRLRKRGERGLDAVVLAACGLDRLGLGGEIGRRFSPEEVLPEAGQGALALQVRVGEEGLVAHADDPETRRRVEAERACVFAIGGGCLAPVAAYHDGEMLTALVAAEDGSWVERLSGEDPAALAAELSAHVGA
jgi:hydroxymethylbilane synthase